jgi:ribosomal protein S18 acetylase RimI-like enzyme
MFVRTAGERDMDVVRDLLIETWHATYDGIYGIERVNDIAGEWHSAASLRARLTRPNSEFLVADDGKRLGGMAFAAATGDPAVVMLHQLYVHPDFQGRGIGKALLEEVEESFPEARMLRLEVEEANRAAIAFYRANGFLPAGTTSDCGGGSDLPALVLEKKVT